MIIEIDTVHGRIFNDKKFLVANYVSETNAMNVTKTKCNSILAKRYFGEKLLLRVVAAALLLYTSIIPKIAYSCKHVILILQ